MSDVTFVRGYGFPRGSSMDYAGYGHYPAGRRSGGGPYRTADGCPMDHVSVGGRCVPFNQIAGFAGHKHLGDCGCGGGCGGCGPKTQPQIAGFARYGRAVRMATPGQYATIPALDGYNETEGETDLSLDPLPITIGERVLPTYDFNTGRWYDQQGNEIDPDTGAVLRPAGGSGGLALLGLAAIGLGLFFWK